MRQFGSRVGGGRAEGTDQTARYPDTEIWSPKDQPQREILRYQDTEIRTRSVGRRVGGGAGDRSNSEILKYRDSEKRSRSVGRGD